MTRDEAIFYLTNMDRKYMEEGMSEALDMAIKALEQEPCEDCISRRAVLYGLASIAKAKAKSDAQKSLMGRVMFFTEHLPSVTPQQKMGHCKDCISREEAINEMSNALKRVFVEHRDIAEKTMNKLPSVTPLPKGHGRLIDESKIKKCGWNFIDHHVKTDAPTIIEADNTESEE